MVECEADNKDRDGHEGRGEPDDDEAGFGLDVAPVSAHVVGTDEVVEPVAQDGADDGTDDWREEEKA